MTDPIDPDLEADLFQDEWDRQREALGFPRCRVCGCGEENPCPGGCSWAEPNLCDRHQAQNKPYSRRLLPRQVT